MGQTLTHGIYLPDEGERNCYNGLAGNWSILDGAVGTIAEHTSALAGKAPLVHTHTKSDITDFPVLANVATSGSYNDLSNIPASFTPASHTHGNLTNDGKVGTTANKPLITGTDGVVQAGSFGNQANTFCEGNDSRLSDARTPVAHTHTKSDVTDLFNSANTWTGSNTISSATNSIVSFKLGTSSSYSELRFYDNNNSYYAGLRYQTSNIILGLKHSSASSWLNGSSVNINSDGSVRIKSYDGTDAQITYFTNAAVYPSVSSITDLGTSTNQWNNLYAKNYYYNGVAWGLDKENEWSANQKITNNPSYLYFKNTSMTMGTAPASNKYSGVIFQDSNNAELGNVTYKKHKNSNNVLVFNVKNTDGTNNYECSASLSLTPSGSASFYPEGVDCNLGQATTPWKTLNGVNPGALSLPDSYINLDTTNWNLTGALINYTPTTDGWLFINIRPDNNYAYVAIEAPHMRNNSENTTGKNAMACIAVRANIQVSITLVGASIAQARLVKCAGNV